MTKYGYFSDDGLEFIITRPDTPYPWINYAINGRYHALISNTGGGYSYYITPRDSRITRRRYNSLPIDIPGRYLYIRDNETKEYWSLTWQPVVNKKLDFYECRHGLGYTKITSEYKGIRGSVTYFVPVDEDIEVWWFSLENKTDSVKRISLFTYVEFCLGLGYEDLVEQPNTQHYNRVYFDEEDNVIYGTKVIGVSFLPKEKQYLDKGCWGKYTFLSTSLKVKGYDCDREVFIGMYRSEANPIVVEKGNCTNSILTSGDGIGSLQSEIEMNPGQNLEFFVILGIVDRLEYKKQTRKILKEWNLNRIKKGFEDLKQYYKELFNKVEVETPDKIVNRMLNIWNKYQCKVNFTVSRDASYFHGGLTYGMGFRDTSQDLLPMIIFDAPAAKEVIKELARNMFKDGSTYHNYFRIVGGGIKTGHSDDPLWFPLAVIMYLKETGDYKFLKEKERYADGGEGTILEHCIRGINYVWTNRSKRNIPLMLNGDWNDDLNECGVKRKGESVMVAEQLCYIVKEMADLFKFLKILPKKVKEYEKIYKIVSEALNKYCWDGKWYIRATKDNGEPIGSNKNKEGKIDHCAQSWAVIAGVAPKDRAVQCMDSCRELLDTPFGFKLCHPAYKEVDNTIGASTREAPGKKENAAIFNHPLTWCIMAETILRRGNLAFHYYKRSIPEVVAKDHNVYKLEPYIYSEYITGPDHHQFGRAGHSWLTGTAAWMFLVAIYYILGVRPHYDGLIIDPCIPNDWKEYKMRRVFRGIKYSIIVRNPNGKNSGIKEIKIDGRIYDTNKEWVKVPIFKDKKEHVIEVTM